MISRLVGSDGLINFLTVIDPTLMAKAIRYIRANMNEGEWESVFNKFWTYFEKIWMRLTPHHTDKGRFLVTSWNIFHLIKTDGSLKQTEEGCDVMVNRTNNPLERFNKTMNERVPKHPTVTNFVDCVKRITHDYVCQMEATRKGLGRKMAKRAPVNIPKIPADFISFEN